MVALAALVGACGAGAAGPDAGPLERSCEHRAAFAAPRAWELDVALAVDDSAAFAAHPDAPDSIGAALDAVEASPCGPFDLRVAVIRGSDGAAAAPVDGVLFSIPRVDGGFDRSVAGTLGAEVAARIRALGTGASDPQQPLAGVRAVVDAENATGGSFRGDSILHVVVASAADDASPESVDAYAEWLAYQRLYPELVRVSATDTARGRALVERFPLRGVVGGLDADGVAALFDQEHRCPEQPPTSGCVAIEDPATECAVTETAGGVETVLPRCGAGDRPCWQLTPSASCGPGFLEVVVERDELPRLPAEVRARCAATCG